MNKKLGGLLAIWVFFAGMLMLSACSRQQSQAVPVKGELILATTTSTQDSGLLDVLLPVFEHKTGYQVKTIAVGTGQALALGEKGEADVLLVHAPAAEKKLIASGAAVNRHLIMHNDFIIVGPESDSAAIKGKTAPEALAAISKKQAVFVSRGDDSGTDKMEKSLWKSISIEPADSWYREAGAGMGQTLKIANEKHGYTLSDRATYLSQKKNLSLAVLVEGDAKLLNIYHVMEVNPERFSKVNNLGAQEFRKFLLSGEGQELISAFGKDNFGQALFFADGGKSEKDFGL